jgi:hypothetical protein
MFSNQTLHASRRQGRFLAPLFLTLLLGSRKKTESTPGPNPFKQNDMAAPDLKLTAFTSICNVPEALLAVSKNGKPVCMKGYGKANAALKLVQEGRLSPDAKVFGTNGVLAGDFGTAPCNANLLSITVQRRLQNVLGLWRFIGQMKFAAALRLPAKPGQSGLRQHL